MPALGGRQPAGYQFLDYSGERKSLEVFTGEITAVSIAGLLGELGDLTAALDAVTLGTIAKTSWGESTVVSNTRPTDKTAQIETELLVLCQGATTEQPWSFRIPTVNYAAFNYADPPAGDSVIISGAGASAATTDLVDAIEAVAKAPGDEAEALVVTGMRVVR
jgi:hypothetical protein